MSTNISLILTLLIWVFLWVVGLGYFFVHLLKNGITYTKNYGITIAYFILMSLFTFILFKSHFEPFLVELAILPFAILAVTILVCLGIYKYGKRRFLINRAYLETHPTEHLLRLDNRYIFSKLGETLLHQILVMLLVAFLTEYGLNLVEIIIISTVLFTATHVALIPTTDFSFGFYFTAAIALSAFIFPPIVILTNYGFIYNIALELLFYTLSAVIFWSHYKLKPPA